MHGDLRNNMEVGECKISNTTKAKGSSVEFHNIAN